MHTSLGVLLWNQATDWPAFEHAARRVDELGYDHLWTWDHVYAIVGDPDQPIFEGYTTLAAWAKVTERVRLGLLVGANPLRNPGIVAKMLTTIDHLSGGRAIAGLGAAWFELEHRANGIEFGTGFGQRLDWMEESADALERLFAGEEVTSAPGATYRFDRLRLHPAPLQARIPIMIGGDGERKTLRSVARHADMWNTSGDADVLRHKIEVLRRHCDEVGRAFEEIELTASSKIVIRSTMEAARDVWAAQMAHNRKPMADVVANRTYWVGPPDLIAERMAELKGVGIHTFIAEQAAPFDEESLERWIGEVRPMVDGPASAASA